MRRRLRLDGRARDLFGHDAGVNQIPLGFEQRFRLDTPEQIEHDGDEAGPPGLVTCPEARPIVAVEILVEENQVAPVRILLNFAVPP